MLTTDDIGAMESRIRAAGLAIDDFCSRVPVDRATWQRWKAGKTGPSLTKWHRVLNTLSAVEMSAREADPQAAE